MRTELIITTYESPRTLVLTLESVLRQRVMPDVICIADDGSGPETAEVIAAFQAAHPEIPLRHVWHEDDGFQRSAILNRAIATSEADLLIVIDGDVLIHPVYVARHVELARPGRFCTGSLIRLDAEASRAVNAGADPVGGALHDGLAARQPGVRPDRVVAEGDAVPEAGR